MVANSQIFIAESPIRFLASTLKQKFQGRIFAVGHCVKVAQLTAQPTSTESLYPQWQSDKVTKTFPSGFPSNLFGKNFKNIFTKLFLALAHCQIGKIRLPTTTAV